MRIYGEIWINRLQLLMKAGLTKDPNTCFAGLYVYIYPDNWPLVLISGVLPKIGSFCLTTRDY